MKNHVTRKIITNSEEISRTNVRRGVKHDPRVGHLLLEDREGATDFSDGDEPVVPAGGPGTGEFRV